MHAVAASAAGAAAAGAGTEGSAAGGGLRIRFLRRNDHLVLTIMKLIYFPSLGFPLLFTVKICALFSPSFFFHIYVRFAILSPLYFKMFLLCFVFNLFRALPGLELGDDFSRGHSPEGLKLGQALHLAVVAAVGPDQLLAPLGLRPRPLPVLGLGLDRGAADPLEVVGVHGLHEGLYGAQGQEGLWMLLIQERDEHLISLHSVGPASLGQENAMVLNQLIDEVFVKTLAKGGRSGSHDKNQKKQTTKKKKKKRLEV